MAILQSFSWCISCFSRKTDKNINEILEKLRCLGAKDLDLLIKASENNEVSRQNINDLISHLANFQNISNKTTEKPDFIAKFVLFLENFINFYLFLQKNSEKTVLILEKKEDYQQENQKYSENHQENQENPNKTSEITENIANNNEETLNIPENNSNNFVEFSPNLKSRNNTPMQNNSSKNHTKDFTKLNKSLACQFVKDFEDFKLIKSPENFEKTKKNRIKTNTNNTNASLFLQENSVFENSEPFFQELRETRTKFKTVKQELSEFQGKNSKLLWENQRKVRILRKKLYFICF